MKRIFAILLTLAPAIVSAQTFDRELQKYNSFYYYLNSLYVDTLDNRSLTEEAIRSVLQRLDPHSAYLPAEEMKSQMEEMSGSFGGIGVSFGIVRDTLTVLKTLPDSPAEKAGLKRGDKITAVGGRNIAGFSSDSIGVLLKGAKDTKVDVTVLRRHSDSLLGFRLTRDEIPMTTIDAAYTVGTTGYIKVNRFAENTMDEFRKAFASLGKIDGLILDLRGNGGGLLPQAIEMAGFFLPRNTLITSTEGRTEKPYNHFSRKKGVFTDLPLAVIIDGSSASASELVSGALQDWDRAVIVGQQSFGKGLVQKQIPMDDGSAIRITTSYYLTPSKRRIQRPFENGRTMEYYNDHAKRMLDRTYRDSLAAVAPKYKTLSTGRTVLGGGGITPDVYIAIDTSETYLYLNRLVETSVINDFTSNWFDRNIESVDAEYPDFETFAAKFQVTDRMIDEIRKAGQERGIEPPTDPNDKSLDVLPTYLKAHIAVVLWDSTEYFRIINSHRSEEFDAAYNIASNPKEFQKILGRVPKK